MVIKFKNGYTVRIIDTEGKSKKELIAGAKKAIKLLEDAELKRTINTNISFSPTRVTEAIKAAKQGDDMALAREIKFLERDLDSDLNKHANYPGTYRKEVIDKLLDQYGKAVDQIWDYYQNTGDAVGLDLVGELAKKLYYIRKNWSRVPYIVRFDTGDEKTFYNVNEAMEYADAAAAKGVVVIHGDYGHVVYDPKNGYTDLRDSKSAKDSDNRKFIVLVKMFGKLLYLGADDRFTSHEDEARKFDFERDAYEAAKAVTKNAPNSYHIIAIYDDDDGYYDLGTLDSAKVDDETPGSEVGRYALLYLKEDKPYKFLGVSGTLTPYVHTSRTFATEDEAIKFLKQNKLSTASYKPIEVTAKLMKTMTGKERNAHIKRHYLDSAAVKDVPYFDPTDYPKIESDYSTERLSRELRHPAAEQDLQDLEGMFVEIGEFIEQGTQALIDAGWSKDDARHAIAARYYPMVKELRKAGRKDDAKLLLQHIHQLEKAWDLIR